MDAAPPQPQGDRADVAVYVKLTLAVLYYISYPIYRTIRVLCILLLQVLKPIGHIVRFITLPFASLAAFLAYVLSLPFKLVARLETVYIFLGTAVLIGLGAGLVLALLASLTNVMLRLDAAEPASQPKRLRSLASFRAARKQTASVEKPPPLPLRPSRKPQSAMPLSPLSPGPGGLRARGLLSSTIIEEEDSEESDTAS